MARSGLLAKSNRRAFRRLIGHKARGVPRPWWWGAVISLAAIAAQELVARWYYRRTPSPTRRLHEDEQTAWTPAWRESLSPLEWLASEIPRKTVVPRGTGAPVVLVPGFLMTGLYLWPMRRRLRTLGYTSHVADIGWNVGCFEALTNRLLADIAAIHHRTSRRVHLVGHSLGGVLAHAATIRHPEHVASLATLGSPVRGLRLHPVLRMAAAAMRVGIHVARGSSIPRACATFGCPCETVRRVADDPSRDIPYLTIATRNDGVADWRYALGPAATVTSVVASSHMGLVFTRTVDRALADHFAGADSGRVEAASSARY
jgi:triacylglycerol lipase